MNSPPIPLESPEVARGDTTAWLIRCFKRLLANGTLQLGARLPPERELAEMFGVSRSSLRQALKVLEIMGVLSQQVSRGTFLNDSSSEILGEPLEFLVLLDDISHYELFEARMILEPELAARAAKRAVAHDLSALREALALMRGSLNDQMKFVEADLAFHDAVLAAAGNRVSRLWLKSLHRQLVLSIARTSGLTNLETSLSYHQAIYQAIRKGDADEARRRMQRHFDFGQDVLRLSSEKEPDPNELRAKIVEIRRSLSDGQ